MDHADGKKGTGLEKLNLADHTRKQQEQEAPRGFISALGAEVSRASFEDLLCSSFEGIDAKT